MQILAHRGAWSSRDEQNTAPILYKALTSGWGIETDIRDLNGELVVSHDMPRDGVLTVAQFLDDYIASKADAMLALNIKSDGLTIRLKQLLDERNITQYFCFDMSVPDTMPYLAAGMNVAARLSEYEPEGPLSERSQVLWVDGFYGLEISIAQLEKWLCAGKQVCLVSPELHGRDNAALWDQLAAMPLSLRKDPHVMLCTDSPLKAQELLG